MTGKPIDTPGFRKKHGILALYGCDGCQILRFCRLINPIAEFCLLFSIIVDPRIRATQKLGNFENAVNLDNFIAAISRFLEKRFKMALPNFVHIRSTYKRFC